MWSDNETTVDYLNFGVVADACTKLLQQAGGEPISIGVSGGWGAGKTSLVRMIESRLKAATKPDENTYVVVTFNPWLYQDFEGARSALLQLVGDEVLRLAAKNESLAKKAKRVLQRINLLRVVQLPVFLVAVDRDALTFQQRIFAPGVTARMRDSLLRGLMARFLAGLCRTTVFASPCLPVLAASTW